MRSVRSPEWMEVVKTFQHIYTETQGTRADMTELYGLEDPIVSEVPMVGEWGRGSATIGGDNRVNGSRPLTQSHNGHMSMGQGTYLLSCLCESNISEEMKRRMRLEQVVH